MLLQLYIFPENIYYNPLLTDVLILGTFYNQEKNLFIFFLTSNYFRTQASEMNLANDYSLNSLLKEYCLEPVNSS